MSLAHASRRAAQFCKLFAVVPVILSLTTTSFAQLAPQTGAAKMREAYTRHLHSTLEKHRLSNRQQMDWRLSNLNAACDLSDEQRTRLQIAAKGAVEYALKERQDQADDFVRTISNQKDAHAIQLLASRFFTTLNQQQNIAAAAQQPIWTKTKDAVLTPEQCAAYEEYVELQTAEERRRAAASVTKALIRKLALKAEQTDPLCQLIESAISEHVRARVGMSGRTISQLTVNWLLLRSIPPEELQAVLTDAQWTKWQALDQQSQGRRPIANVRHPSASR